ncbi:MAG: ABC transporter permease subunit [Deltaproteobacteria bacterium]|nr:ABC transporter permease subunit [Deltaproteobacteria bacterium]
MRSVFRIARTEVLEHRRQPWMIFILAANYALWISIFGILFLILDGIASRPESLAALEQQLKGFGIGLDALLQLATSTFGSLCFTNLPLFVAIMSGTSVLHDRDCGSMPFLMLAPLTRRQLLMGKLAGAMAIPLCFHLLFVGTSSILLGRLGLLAPYAHKLGASPAWWIAFLVGAPASAAFVGALGTVISALSRDMRTSMQYTSFFIGLLSLGIGFVLVDGIPEGAVLQLGYAGGCMLACALILLFGAHLISRDVTVT